MIEQAKNKMQGRDNIKEAEQAFFYPDYQISITASSQEEADKKLAEQLESKTK